MVHDVDYTVGRRQQEVDVCGISLEAQRVIVLSSSELTAFAYSRTAGTVAVSSERWDHKTLSLWSANWYCFSEGQTISGLLDLPRNPRCK